MEDRFALLIDADNVSAKYIKPILDELSKYGNVTYKRIYGDWTKTNNASWKEELLQNSITPIQQFSYTHGKNATDSAMIIDAMDMLYTSELEGFCLVSSDSDFTKLVYRLKESGKIVIGMGESKTKEALAKACDEFKILNLIYQTEEETSKPDESNVEDAKNDKKPNKNTSEKELYEEEFLDDEDEEEIDESEISIPELSEISSYISSYIETLDSERVNLATLGNVLKKRFSGFDARNYKFSNMTQMMRKIDGFRVESENAPDGVHKVVYISLDEKK